MAAIDARFTDISRTFFAFYISQLCIRRMYAAHTFAKYYLYLYCIGTATDNYFNRSYGKIENYANIIILSLPLYNYFVYTKFPAKLLCPQSYTHQGMPHTVFMFTPHTAMPQGFMPVVASLRFVSQMPCKQ